MGTVRPDKPIGWTAYHREAGGRKVMHDGTLKDSAHLYHMLPWPYALRILVDRRLRLSPVGGWDDPYEKWWCDLLFGRQGPLSGQVAYGLCFTTGIYDEPRWRMAAFRRSEPVVRIRCRVGPLLSACGSVIGTRAGSFYLGTVGYESGDLLVDLARSVAAGSRKEVTRTAAAMLLRKRIAFAFEHEVRLLWLERGASADAFYIAIDPATIDQIMITPHASKVEAHDIRGPFVRSASPCKAFAYHAGTGPDLADGLFVPRFAAESPLAVPHPSPLSLAGHAVPSTRPLREGTPRCAR